MLDVVRVVRGVALAAVIGLASSAPVEAQEGSPATDSAAREVLEKHIAAIGGRELLNSIRTVEIRQDREVFGQIQKSYTITELVTGRTYSRVEGSSGVVEMGFDGRRAWRRTPFFRGYLEANDPAGHAMINRQRPIHEYQESGVRYARLPNETVDGLDLIVLRSTRADHLGREIPVKLYFDPRSYLLVRRVEGEAVQTVARFADFRPVDGRLVAFTTTTESPQVTVTSRVQAIRYNVPVADSLFEYREAGGAVADSATTPASLARGPEAATAGGTFAPDDVIPEALRRQTFEQVWRTVRDTYWDTTFGGINWSDVRERYLPRALTEARSEPYHQMLSEMVGVLGQSHFSVVPPHRVVSLASGAGPRNNGETGVTLQWVAGTLLVERVADSSPAAAAGIRPGYIVTRIDGKSPEQLYRDFRQRMRGVVLGEELARGRAAQMALAGRPDSAVRVDVVNERGDTVSLALERAPRAATAPTELETRRLDGGIAYIRLAMFGGDVLPRFREAVRAMAGAPGLIIDLRGNPGGVADVATGIASLLSERDGSLGSSRFRYETRQHGFKGTGTEAYEGRVVLLVDARTASSGEVFSAGLQELGRATVVGARTAGAVLPSVMRPLPSGGALQHAISEYRTPRGTLLEGRGVVPDIAAPRPTREALLAGRDLALEEAMRAITRNRSN